MKRIKILGWRMILLFTWVILGIVFVERLNDIFKIVWIIGTIGGVFWAGFGDSGDLEKFTYQQEEDKLKQKKE